MSKEYIIAVDFDGTIVTHDFPEVGQPAPEAINWLTQWQAHGAKIILWTMRSGATLLDATHYLKNLGIELFGVNRNPEQYDWTKSPKAYAHVYIDDAAFGCPLRHDLHRRPVVDWSVVGPAILKRIQEQH